MAGSKYCFFCAVTAALSGLAQADDVASPSAQSDLTCSELTKQPQIEASALTVPVDDKEQIASSDVASGSISTARGGLAFSAEPMATVSKDGYTINYNTVSIVEYIRFASKICNVNFIFTEADLPFTVTVVSDAPVTPENVMATLIQTLRIHGLMLIELGNNLVIHKTAGVRQPATLVFDNEKSPVKSSLITRVFRLKNANVDSVAAVIRPMVSEGALLEVSRETRQIILTDATMIVDKIVALIENLDSAHTAFEIRNFETKFNKPDYLIDLANQIMKPIAQGNPFILVPQSLANTIFIVSTPELNEKAAAVLTSLDTPPKKTVLAERKIRSENIFVVRLDHRVGDEVLHSLKDMAVNLQQSGVLENDLIETIESGKWVRESNSLMFVGSAESSIKVKELVSSLDIPTGGEKSSFFVYKPQYRSIEEIQKSMLEMADSLVKAHSADDLVIAAIRSQKLNPSTHTLLYSGDPATFSKIRELLLTVDTPTGKKTAQRLDFFVYKIKAENSESVRNSLQSFAKNLEASGIAEEGIVEAIRSVKYISETNSLVFVAPGDVLQRLQELLPQFDVAVAGAEKMPASSQFLAYKPKYQKGEVLVRQLKETKDNLHTSLADPALLHTLESMKWVKNTNTLLFTGDPASLKKMEDLIATIDTPGSKDVRKAGYFVYKLQNPHGEAVEEDMANLVRNMKTSGMKDSPLVGVLENMRYVRETNSLLLTGDPAAIEEAKELIAKNDVPRVSNARSNFVIYKPQSASPAKFEKGVTDVIAHLQNAQFADPQLLSALSSMKYVDATHSFVFTGNPDAIGKIQEVLKEIDATAATAPIQVGKVTFYFYKLKSTSGQQIIASLKNVSADLKKTGATDFDFISALDSAKYVKESNSIMFTGTDDALTKVQSVVTQFDATEKVSKPPSKAPVETSTSATDFFVYKPSSVSAQDLEATLQDFAENLRAGGLNDPGLFNTLNAMKYNEKTQSLLFTGDPKTLERMRQLLRDFDVSANLPIGAINEPTIQAIDNTSFLVYKLEFHKGDEIQNALRQIAKDLIKSNAPVNQNLLNSINSIQWLEVTNSLLCSGDQETLTRLRELIKNLDIPLKQVFIEVLVIETSLSNAVNFGLEWGGKFQYQNVVSGSFNNFLPNSSSSYPYNTSQYPSGTFENALQNTGAGGVPAPSSIPFAPTFETGVIGDIIRHNGNSYVSLGSLLNALESDRETTVVMTPKIVAQDSRTATIFSGQNVPYAGSFVSTSGTSTIQTANLEYRDIGVSLSITPVLGNSDIITLDVSLDNSSGTTSGSGSQINFGTSVTGTGITTNRMTMSTTVHVPNRHFLILSGVVANSNIRTKSGIPCLGGLPLIGSAFSNNGDSTANSNIVIFMRPTIINTLEEMKRLTSEQEEFFRSQAGTPSNEHNFDEAMELIKSPDDE
jgi:type III secretion protein C